MTVKEVIRRDPKNDCQCPGPEIRAMNLLSALPELIWELVLVDQACDLADARFGQLVLGAVGAVGPEDCRCGSAIQTDKVEGLPRRAQRVTGKHQIINQMDGCAGRQPFAGEPAITDRWVVAVGNEVGLWR